MHCEQTLNNSTAPGSTGKRGNQRTAFWGYLSARAFGASANLSRVVR